MLKYKIDIIQALRDKGVNSGTCRFSGQLSQSAFAYMKKGEIVGTKSIDQICSILRCQPGDLIEWVPDPEEK